MKKLFFSLNLVFLLLSLLISCSKDSNDSDTKSGLDPYLQYQWYIENTGQSGGIDGIDMNVKPVWAEGITGQGVTVAVVDDGMDVHHEDLKENNILSLNFNYLNGSNDTTGSGDCLNVGGSSCHGTSVAGIIAAQGDNLTGIKGIAHDAKLVAYNLLQNFSSTNELDALTRNHADIFVSSNSWGPTDTTGEFQPATESFLEAIDIGLTDGRSGKGSIYVWAAGNGAVIYDTLTGNAYPADQSNYDGYANYYGVIAVAAVTDQGVKAVYSEYGANLWVSATSSGGESGIFSTDVTGSDGYDEDNEYFKGVNYFDSFSGTSAATPMVSGIVSLMLQANPDLGWRDVKLILARSARKIDSSSPWAQNKAGYNISYRYGFGLADASAAVELSKNWQNVSTMYTYESTENIVSGEIPDGDSETGITDTINVPENSIKKIEYVAIDVNIDHPEAGELALILTAPGGTQSILAVPHYCVDLDASEVVNCEYYKDGNSFRFGSARHLGEDSAGEWQLQVLDAYGNNDTEEPYTPLYTGSLNSWKLTFYGRQD